MRGGSRSLCVCVLVAIAACPDGLVAEHGGRESLARIDVLLTTPPTLSETARASMIDEATAIWRQHGVVIDWLSPTAMRPDTSHRLRVVILQKRARRRSHAGACRPRRAGEAFERTIRLR